MEIKSVITGRLKKTSHYLRTFYLDKNKNIDYDTRKFFHITIFISLFLSVFLFYFFFNYIKTNVYSMPAFEVNSEYLKIKKLPDWILDFAKEIKPLYLPEKISIFNPHLCQIITKGYLANPWVKDVEAIIKNYPDNIYVKLKLRHPIAFIQMNNVLIPCSQNYIRLPFEIKNYKNFKKNLPVLIGITSDIPAIGKKWKNPQIKEGLNVISLLKKHNLFDTLLEKEVHIKQKELFSYKVITLFTKNKTQIIWGKALPDNCNLALEEKRIRILKKLQSKFFIKNSQNIDRNIEIDIRFGYIIIKGTKYEPK